MDEYEEKLLEMLAEGRNQYPREQWVKMMMRTTVPIQLDVDEKRVAGYVWCENSLYDVMVFYSPNHNEVCRAMLGRN